MGICPVCNNLKEIYPKCPSCKGMMKDSGKVMDYYDDYSPYMPTDQLKLEDGYSKDYKEEECPHLYFCNECGYDKVLFIQEEDPI